MLKAMVAGSQHQLLEHASTPSQSPCNDTMYCYDYYQHYHPGPGQGSPSPASGPQPQANGPQDLCPQLCAIHPADYGPVTVPMVSTNSSPPIAMPVQVPHGHVVQQIVDESGTLRHVILSPQHPPMVPMPTHFGPGPASGSNQPHQPFFPPQGLPPGYPFGHGTPLQPGLLGHVHPSQQGHSPPPAHNFHKDERTQRQYNKLRKKLEQKNQGVRGVTPPSPRKDFVNGVRQRKGMGGGSVGTSEDGDGEESSSVQDEDDDPTLSLISDFLANIKSPQVAEVNSRSVLLQWWPPDCKANPELEISESDLRYEVLLSDKGKEGKYKPIYSGAALSCRIQDLRPGTEYSVCVTAWLSGVVGSASEPTTLRTPPCEPDPPTAPKLITRSRTALQLRWTAAVDNGSHITQYVLESDQGNGKWSEVYRGKGKQCNLTKLQPATCYNFRLSAVNECGTSEYSEEVMYWTSDSPPPQPAPPTLLEAKVTSLSLQWERRPCDEDFMLQMEDRESGHGFLAVYSGKDTIWVCRDLHRHSFYKFRLKALNVEGGSQWSEEVGYRTLPARPFPPCRLAVKGRVHAHYFKVKWEPPVDRGGADITSYTLQIKKNGEFNVAYVGMETEFVLDRLNPGTQYEVRVSCETAGGRSDFCETLVISTEPVCPGQCAPPRLHGKPRPHSIALKWSYPEVDGGSPITECQLVMRSAEDNNDNSEHVTVYQGQETECVVTELLPGHRYLFLLRASNRMGAGHWSEPLEVRSGAAPPGPVSSPILTPRGHSMNCSWTEPPSNGAPVTEYRLELAHGSSLDFSTVYHGPNTSCEIRNIPPATLCHFRLQAYSSAGWSDYSIVSSILSPAGPPGPVPTPHYTATPTSLHLTWSAPPDHGDPITHYTVDIGERSVSSQETTCDIHELTPHTTYRVRIRGVNGVGAGPYSLPLKASTLPLPPSPPPLTCVNISHNYLKLKWGEGKNTSFTEYTVYMSTAPCEDEFVGSVVYQGHSFSCKVNRLLEQTTYRFAISASNDAGSGPLSDVYEFTTAIAPPPSLKGIKVSDIGIRSCNVEWQGIRRVGTDPIVYCVQLARLRNQEYKQVYMGSETKVSVGDLEPGAEYLVRVASVRQTSTGDLMGPFSQPAAFSTLPLPDNRTLTPTPKPHHSQATGRKQLSDQEWAIIMLCGFITVSVLAAVIMQHFIY